MVELPRALLIVFGALSLSAVMGLSFAAMADAAHAERPTTESHSPEDERIITYTGPETWTYDDGVVKKYQQTFGADCSSGTCILFIDTKRTVPSNVEIIDGYASVDIAAVGTPCTKNHEYAGKITAVFTGKTATLTQVEKSTRLITCPSGERTRYVGFTSVTKAHYVSGNLCFLTGTCPKPEPTATPIAKEATGTLVRVASPRGMDEPSTLSALPTADAAITLRNVLWASAMAVILALLVAFPKHLLSSAVSTGSKRIARWGEKFRGVAGDPWKRLRSFVARITSIKGWEAATIGIALAAVISSFIDPEFGWNAASIRTVISILVSLALQIATGWLLLIWLVRRTHPSATTEFEFRPLTLLVVVAAVLLSRLTEFTPGIIFGLVAGLSFGALLTTAERARVALIGLARAFVLSLLAWFGYSLMAPILDGGPVIVFITETLSALTIAGMVALPIALIPFPGTTGDMLWKWNRWAWIWSYIVGLIGFFVILMPMPFSWKAVPVSLSTWVGLFVAYAVVSVIIWAIIVRPWEQEKPSANPAAVIEAHEAVSEEPG